MELIKNNKVKDYRRKKKLSYEERVIIDKIHKRLNMKMKDSKEIMKK